MKEFVKATLAVICGIFLFCVVGFIFFLFMAGSMAVAGSSTVQMPRDGVLVMDMSKFTLCEQSVSSSPLDMLQQGKSGSIGIWDATRAIDAAATDPAVRYIYLKADCLIPQSLALTGELRASLAKFRDSGKAIIAYTDMPTTQSYYLSSVADKVFTSSAKGMTNMITGVSSQLFFLGDLLKNLGVDVKLIRHGKYKSAGETFVKNCASTENLEQNQKMIDSMWDAIASEICSSREISRESLDEAIDGLKLDTADDFVRKGLFDEVLTKDELKSRLADLSVEEDYDDIKFISFQDYVDNLNATPSKAREKIAVIYANGEIVDGRETAQVAGDRFASIISKVRADSSVKAVVLRVNSPGGSVMASDKIHTEIEALKAVKPVAASYGDYAASGGYWISAGCDKIFTDRLTLTGSIGVFSMIPSFGGTLDKIVHVNITSVGSHKHSDMLSMMRPLDEAETAFMQRSVDNIYEAFVDVVSSGRGMSRERVDEMGQGRVWTGSDALELGLVDEIGTLEDAVLWAAAAAGNADLSAWKVEARPAAKSQVEMILEMIMPSEENVLAGTAFENLGSAVLSWKKAAEKGRVNTAFARIPYEIRFN